MLVPCRQLKAGASAAAAEKRAIATAIGIGRLQEEGRAQASFQWRTFQAGTSPALDKPTRDDALSPLPLIAAKG